MVIKDKTILITGGNGFIGSHLVERLLKFTPNIVVASETLRANSYFVRAKLHKKVSYEPIDIRSRQQVEALSERYRFDFIFHLAAKTIVEEAYQDPHESFETNIMGTVNLLEYVRKHKVPGIIVASSDKAYGKNQSEYEEATPLKGDHPYDVSKSAADLISQTYFKTYKTPVVITRFGNVYGPGDTHMNRIIPGICDAIINRKKLLIRSDGSYVRDYVYVKDVVEGYLFLMKNFQKIQGEAFNFSSSNTFSVLDLIKKAGNITHSNIDYSILNTAKNEIPFQHLNDDKIRKMGWENKFTLEDSFTETLQWYKEFFK